MDFICYWSLVSGDSMIKLEVDVMVNLNENKKSWVEYHQSMWYCRILDAAEPRATGVDCKMCMTFH